MFSVKCPVLYSLFSPCYDLCVVHCNCVLIGFYFTYILNIQCIFLMVVSEVTAGTKTVSTLESNIPASRDIVQKPLDCTDVVKRLPDYFKGLEIVCDTRPRYIGNVSRIYRNTPISCD